MFPRPAANKNLFFLKKNIIKGSRNALFLEDNLINVLRHFFRATAGIDRICSFWRSPGLPEKEPWIKWQLLQRPGYQTTNKSDVTASDDICLANRRWHELLVLKICKLNNFPNELRLLKLSSSDVSRIFQNGKNWELRKRRFIFFGL